MAENSQEQPKIDKNSMTSVAGSGESTQSQNLSVEAEVAKQPENPMVQYMMWLALIVVWGWWFMNRSKNSKKKKALEARMNELEKGDKIITIDRMHATIVAFDEATITVKPDPKSDFTMTFDRQALHKRLPRPGENFNDEAKA